MEKKMQIEGMEVSMSFAMHRREIHRKMARNTRPTLLQRLEQSAKDKKLNAKTVSAFDKIPTAPETRPINIRVKERVRLADKLRRFFHAS